MADTSADVFLCCSWLVHTPYQKHKGFKISLFAMNYVVRGADEGRGSFLHGLIIPEWREIFLVRQEYRSVFAFIDEGVQAGLRQAGYAAGFLDVAVGKRHQITHIVFFRLFADVLAINAELGQRCRGF